MNKYKKEDGTSLSQFYNDLKSDMNKPVPNPMMKVSGGMMGDHVHPGVHAFRHQAAMQAKQLANDCHRHMLIDLYAKVIPLDKGYVDGHHGQMCQDVDGMLAGKGVDATQYLTSCYEATHAPLLEFMLRAGNQIAQQFKEEAEETLKDAQKNDIEVPAPQAPKADDADVQSQLVDVKEDPEYENFVAKLKEKTIKKIVNDVSKIIADKKNEKSMTFDTPDSGAPLADQEAQLESTTSVGVNYINKHLFNEFRDAGFRGFRAEKIPKEKKEEEDGYKKIKGSDEMDGDKSRAFWDNFFKQESAEMMDGMLGLAIREATLNEINTCFRQPGTSFREYANRIRLGKGYVITEAAIQTFMEELSDKAKKAVEDATATKAADATKLAETLEQSKKNDKDSTEKIKNSVDGEEG